MNPRSDPHAPAGRLEHPGDLIVAVVGPTASGKSDLGLDLAQTLPSILGSGPGHIVSADALQLYRGMDIGTAKTPVEERRGIAHHQIDVLDVTEEASVATYQSHARADIDAIHANSECAIVVGGSGLYQRALLDQLDFPGTDPTVRATLENEAEGPLGARGLHDRLKTLDPVSALRIDPHNVRRIIRALEVIEITGRPYSSSMPKYEFIKPAVMIAIRHDIGTLDERIAVRTRRMFNEGLVEETRELLKRGLDRGRTASRATGYAEAIALVQARMSRDEAIESVTQATRRLARKQIKWLRPDPRVIWLDADEPKKLCARATRTVTCALEVMLAGQPR